MQIRFGFFYIFKVLRTRFLCYLEVSLSGRISKALSREQKLLPRLANQKVRHCICFMTFSKCMGNRLFELVWLKAKKENNTIAWKLVKRSQF